MISVIVSSRRSGSSGPRPMISSVICSSIRTRSARVRARPSSSMTLPKISSIWRRTSTWLERSSFGSRSWMTRLWIRNLTSRNDSRTGRGGQEALGRARGSAAPPGGRRAAGRGRRGPAGAGVAGPVPPGRALSIRFSRDIVPPPLQAPEGAFSSVRSPPCEERLLRAPACAAPRLRSRRRPEERPGEAEDVLRDLGLAIADEERHAPVEGVDDAPAVADDRVVDLPADRVLDVRDADPERRVGPVEDQLASCPSGSRAARRPPGRGACS